MKIAAGVVNGEWKQKKRRQGRDGPEGIRIVEGQLFFFIGSVSF